MGQTLANLGPQLGQAGQGFIQGRQMATQEDQSRQMMALRAAQEGRAKEEHRLSIQQLGLQIQDQMRMQQLNAKLDPMRVQQEEYRTRDSGGRQIEPDYAARNELPGFTGTRSEGEFIRSTKMNEYKAETGRINSQRPTAGEVEKPIDALKILEGRERQLRADQVKLSNDLTGGRIKPDQVSRAQVALRRIQYELLPQAEKATREFRAKHPNLGTVQATGGNDLLSDD